jgi:uridine kinase
MKLARTIKYDHSKSQKDIDEFMEELPKKLRYELEYVMHKQKYAGIVFF